MSGVVWRKTWGEVETDPGVYDFQGFDDVLTAIAGSRNPQCQLWLFVEFKSFGHSELKNPCPAHLQAQHSGLNNTGNGAATCFMREPEVPGLAPTSVKVEGRTPDRIVMLDARRHGLCHIADIDAYSPPGLTGV